MKLIDVNWSPTDRQLRQFGILCLIALPLAGWIWGAGSWLFGGLLAAGLLIGLMGVAFPRAVCPLFLALTIVATPMGVVIGEVALLLIYFGVFLPTGVLFRLRKRDALQLRIDKSAATYWQAKRKPQSAATYYRQS